MESQYEANIMSSDEEDEGGNPPDRDDDVWNFDSGLVFRERRDMETVTLNEDLQGVQITLDSKALNKLFTRTSQENKVTVLTLTWEKLESSRFNYFICEVGLLDDNKDVLRKIVEGLTEEGYKRFRYLTEKFFRNFQTRITRLQVYPLSLELVHPSPHGFDELKSRLGDIEDDLMDICSDCAQTDVSLNVILRLGENPGEYDDMEFTLTIYGSDTESDDIHNTTRSTLSPREKQALERQEEAFSRLQLIEQELQSQKEHFSVRFDQQEANKKEQGEILKSLTENVNRILQTQEQLLKDVKKRDSQQSLPCQDDVRPKIRTPQLKGTGLPNKYSMDSFGKGSSKDRRSHIQKTPENSYFMPLNHKLSSSSPNLNQDQQSMTSRTTSKGIGFMNFSPIPHQPERQRSYDGKRSDESVNMSTSRQKDQLSSNMEFEDSEASSRYESVSDKDLFPSLQRGDSKQTGINIQAGRSSQGSVSERNSFSNQKLPLKNDLTEDANSEITLDLSPRSSDISGNQEKAQPPKNDPRRQASPSLILNTSPRADDTTEVKRAHTLANPTDAMSSRRAEAEFTSLGGMQIDQEKKMKQRNEHSFSSLPTSTSEVKIKDRAQDEKAKVQRNMTGSQRTTEEKRNVQETTKATEKTEQIRPATQTPTLYLRSSHVGLGRARHFLDKHGVHGTSPGVRRMIETIEAAIREEGELPPRTRGMNTVLCLDTSDGIGETGFKSMKESVLDYLDGIEDIAARFETEENIAVVSFGGPSKILHHLSNDYTSIRTVVENLSFGGQASLFEALLVCLCETNGRASPTLIGETKYPPRIIIVTGGNTTDDIEEGEDDEETIENNSKDRVVKLLDGFCTSKDEQSQPQPLIWVPLESGDRGFVEFLSEMEICNLCEYKDMKDLCKYQRSKEIFETAYTKIKDSIVLKDDKGIDVEDIRKQVDEVAGEWDDRDKDAIVVLIQRRLANTLTKTQLNPKTLASDFNNVVELKDEDLPRLGMRVVRGADWPGGEEDGKGAGTVINHIDGQEAERKIIWVLWDTGACRKYKYGYQEAHDVVVVKDKPRQTTSEMIIEIGCEVTRGKDWMSQYEDQDGGAGGVGVVIRKDDRGNVKVRWNRNCKICDYRYGINNKIDLRMRDPVESLMTSMASSQSMDNTSNKELSSKDETTEKTVWVWQRRSETDGWILYDELANQKLEKEYNRRKEGSCVVQRNNESFRVSFKMNTEKKVDGDLKSDVRRICLSPDDLAVMRK